MKKKILLIILATAVILALTLCGCDTATDVFGALISDGADTAEESEVTPEEEVVEEVPEVEYPIRVMSYNMRCYNLSDNDQDNWIARRQYLVQRVINDNPDIIGTQELTLKQKDYLIKRLGNKYTIVGVPRDVDSEGEPYGEGSYIFYRTAKFELLDSGTEWLSETPDVVSRGWDGACNRVVTYVKLRHIESGKVFMHFNTHLDHKGDLAQANGNNQILELIKAADVPVIYTGDFNHTEESPNYVATTAVLNDSKYVAEISDTGYSYTGYKVERANDATGLPIDHCFVSASIKVKSYTIDNELIDGWFCSDHFPVIVDILIK